MSATPEVRWWQPVDDPLTIYRTTTLAGHLLAERDESWVEVTVSPLVSPRTTPADANPPLVSLLKSLYLAATEYAFEVLGIPDGDDEDEPMPADIAECGCDGEQGLRHLIWHLSQRDALAAQITAVRALHTQQSDPSDGSCQGDLPSGDYGYLDTWCKECSDVSGREYGVAYPCPTIRALDAAQTGEPT